jgi:hypothetical protein
MTAEPAVVIPLQIDDEEGDDVSVRPQLRKVNTSGYLQSMKSSMNTSDPNLGAAHHHHHHLQHHAQPGQMLRRTSAAILQRGPATISANDGDEHSEMSFSYLHSPASSRPSPRRKINMTSPTAARFNYGVSASPGSRLAGTMPSPTQSPSSRLTIPNGLPLSP